ncbi:hypothetical protein G5C60_16725 [Streptomyces sp. HC44]|uniref:Uncharacterized protein n=1 Tax=Streptomyces scabichelini TaxID=2711217 RepID=A0A6G4V5S3_9ACTN|nr:hypothetical protein [Streptomyces scabichelini]NGO09200.1 hypothetical protein [Streptomyces scabichelini]
MLVSQVKDLWSGNPEPLRRAQRINPPTVAVVGNGAVGLLPLPMVAAGPRLGLREPSRL